MTYIGDFTCAFVIFSLPVHVAEHILVAIGGSGIVFSGMFIIIILLVLVLFILIVLLHGSILFYPLQNILTLCDSRYDPPGFAWTTRV